MKNFTAVITETDKKGNTDVLFEEQHDFLETLKNNAFKAFKKESVKFGHEYELTIHDNRKDELIIVLDLTENIGEKIIIELHNKPFLTGNKYDYKYSYISCDNDTGNDISNFSLIFNSFNDLYTSIISQNKNWTETPDLLLEKIINHLSGYRNFKNKKISFNKEKTLKKYAKK